MATTRKFSSMGERIHAGMVTTGISSARELARRAGVPHQTLHRWLHADVQSVDAKMIIRLGDEINLSANWLLTGEGNPNKRMPVSPSEAELVLIFRDLSPPGQSILTHCAKQLLEASP